MAKRIKAKTRENQEGFKIIPSVRNRFWEWIWWIGMIAGLSLVFLFPIPEGMTFLNELGMFILVVLGVSILLIYTWRFWPNFLASKQLCLITLLVVSTALMGRIVIILPQVSNYFIPIAFLSILVSLLFTPYFSVVITLLLSVLFSVSARSLEILP
ncbi:MAG: hypothetical protein U9R03_01800, partial [Candidatus Aerophobetes bacterium]|nr:hypothetical protein [Candidatus Aerophobetes bacterium]